MHPHENARNVVTRQYLSIHKFCVQTPTAMSKMLSWLPPRWIVENEDGTRAARGLWGRARLPADFAHSDPQTVPEDIETKRNWQRWDDWTRIKKSAQYDLELAQRRHKTADLAARKTLSSVNTARANLEAAEKQLVKLAKILKIQYTSE